MQPKATLSKKPFKCLLFVSSFFFTKTFLCESFQTSDFRPHAQLQFSITGNLVLLFSAPSLSVMLDGV